MSEIKRSDQGDRQLTAPAVKPLESSDAQAIATPSGRDKRIAEAERTNQSTGSLTELALKTKGLTREQIAAQMDAQDDSISIDYGNGQEATRKNGLTEKALARLGGKSFDARSVLDYENQTGRNLGGSTDAKTVSEHTELYEYDKSKIIGKPLEAQTYGLCATGLDYNTEGQPSNKLLVFAQSAAARAMSPEAWQAAIQGFIDKTIGIGEGLNQAKEEVKIGSLQATTAAWTALRDGSVARFMAQPNAINEPLFKTIGNSLDVMSRNPHVVNNVLSVLGRELEAANNQYSKMSEHDRGVQDGKAMFWFINPSGRTEAGDLALKIADNVATHVDAKVMQTVARTMKAAQELAATSGEAALQTKQMLLDYLNSKGISGPQLKLAGIPDGYFDGMKPSESPKVSDTINAMSKADDLGNGSQPKEVKSGKSQEVSNEALDNPEGLAKLAKKFGINMPPKDTYVLAGNKDAISADAAAKRLGISKERLEKLDETALAAAKLERVPNYRDVFFNAHPGLIPVADRITVHHAIPKWFLKEHPGLFSAGEVNQVDSLRGIYKGINDELHNDKMHNAWRRFSLNNSNPTRQQVLQIVEQLDKKYGRLFIPTEGQ